MRMSRRSLRHFFFPRQPKRRPALGFSRLAAFLACATLAALALAARPSSGGPQVSRNDALPRPAERLARPIWLPRCGMNIVEWRNTAAFKEETTESQAALAVMDDTCRDTFARYDAFLKYKKLPRLRERPDILPAISLLPGNTLLDGKSARALNDLPSRFEAVAPGCCYWGLYVDTLSHLFLRNDPLIRDANGALVPNPRFVRTLTHEISHILSSRLGVWDVVGYDRQKDEALAEDFVAFMGMRFPAESSAEDLAYHRGGSHHPATTPAPSAAEAAASAAANCPAPAAPTASAITAPQR
jgi:hypothetical protein